MEKTYFEVNPKSYPIVLIPHDILENFETELSNNQICKELNVNYPKYNEIPKPIEPSRFLRTEKTKTKINSEGGGCILSILIFIIILAIFSITFQSEVGIFFLIVSSFFFFFNSKNPLGSIFETENYYDSKKIDEEKYQILLKDFKEEIIRIDKENNKNKKAYEVEKEKINLLINENRSLINYKYFISYFLPEVSFIKLAKNNNRGKSEIYFLSYLFEKFNNNIYVDVVPAIGKNPFQPDFLLICKETGIHIDIEIDEPYSVDNGKPIHHDRSKDDERDVFFLEINWGVIRFTERQVIENPKECVYLIQNVLFSIRNKKKYFEHKVPLCKKWTYEEALLMNNNDYRNSYLPSDMKIKVNYTNNNSSFEMDDLPF